MLPDKELWSQAKQESTRGILTGADNRLSLKKSTLELGTQRTHKKRSHLCVGSMWPETKGERHGRSAPCRNRVHVAEAVGRDIIDLYLLGLRHTNCGL